MCFQDKEGGQRRGGNPYGNRDIRTIIGSFTVCFREKTTPIDDDSNMVKRFTCILTLCFIGVRNEALRARHHYYLGPHHKRVKGCDYVIVRTLDFHPKALRLTWFAVICVRPTSLRWT